jgi:uncharacterized protein YndB with AHSA1/START domain
MPEPLRYRFRVGCPVERAFELWTASAGVWWPMATHSVSGRRDSVLVIEPGPGGRVYERTADGQQFSWGVVVAWEPPARLVYEWLVGDTPTELEVRFAADADGGTVVEIEHRGWERFGEAGGDRRDRNDRGWSGVLPLFAAACGLGSPGPGERRSTTR